MLSVRTASSKSSDPDAIAAELQRDADQDGATVLLYFVSPRLATEAVAAAVQRAFSPMLTLGCTTAGEISTDGFGEGSVAAMSLKSPGLRVGYGISAPIEGSPLIMGREAALQAVASLGIETSALSRNRHVAVSLIDGRSRKEESFIAGAASAIPQIELIGGSASDDVTGPARTRLLVDGRALRSAGMVLIFESDIPFATVVSSHLEPTAQKVVVTESDPARRIVHELNGRPALEVYREILGREDVDNLVAGSKPFCQIVGGRAYIRSVMSVEGNSLQFACAVENGVVLRLVSPGDLLTTTAEALSSAEQAVGGEIVGLIAFNCLGRFLEAEATGKTRALGDVLARYPVVGFNSFGEQAGALHVNHTLTGLVFGRGRA